MTTFSHLVTPEPTKPLTAQLLDEWAAKLSLVDIVHNKDVIDAVEWIEDNYLVDRPRNPKDAAMLQPGPIQLADYQKRIIQEALSRDGDGKLNYSTIVWSEPKKSGKTAIAAAIGLYMAEINDAAHIYCLANDGKQSQDRIFNAMARCMILHAKLGGMYQGIKATYSPPTIKLSKGSIIEAIPCDAAGEAGSEPLMSIWCFDDQTEVLTDHGWRTYDTILPGDKVYTLTEYDNVFTYQSINAINRQQYDGPMHRLVTNDVDMCISPNHRVYGKFGLNESHWELLPIEQALTYSVMWVCTSVYGSHTVRVQANQWYEEDYHGTIWCPSIDSGIICVRRNGKVYWTGNSELWGYAQKHKERIWTELTIPPTLYGYAMRWVESYAGYEGESTTLWQLYDVGVNHGERHPLFPDLPVYVNHVANQFTFWSHEARQPWQTKDYYAAEEKLLTPNEFRRVHRNQWVTSTTALFEDMIHWDRCKDPIAGALPKGDSTPVIVAIDAGYAGDCAAIVAVSRHPDDDWDAEFRRVVERYTIAFTPTPGHPLDFTQTIEPAIRRICEDYNVYMVVYDPYQLHKLAMDMKIAGIAPFQEFSQAGRRLRADRQFYDMVIHGQYHHSGNPEMRYHVQNCAKKEEGLHMRFEKKAANKPIDLVVAASMAVDECLTLNI